MFFQNLLKPSRLVLGQSVRYLKTDAVFQHGKCAEGIFSSSRAVVSRKYIPRQPNQFTVQASKRYFRTTSPHHALPPWIVLTVGRMAKIGAIFLGSNLRRWWASLPPEQKAEYAERAKKNRKYIVALAGLLGYGILVYYDSHLQETPYTKRKRFVIFKSEQLDELAREEYRKLVAYFRPLIIPANPRNRAYARLSHVANKLVQSNKDLEQFRNKKWSITVVDEPKVHNALVLTCGNIFVFTGVLNICKSDDELAMILAHEMAHAVLGHDAENASYGHIMDLITVVPVALIWAVLPTAFSAAFAHLTGALLQGILFSLPYSRAMEVEADEVGLFLAARACFDVRKAPAFWARIARQEVIPQIEWLSTHPNHESRQKRLEEVMATALNLREDAQCPVLPDLDLMSE